MNKVIRIISLVFSAFLLVLSLATINHMQFIFCFFEYPEGYFTWSVPIVILYIAGIISSAFSCVFLALKHSKTLHLVAVILASICALSCIVYAFLSLTHFIIKDTPYYQCISLYVFAICIVHSALIISSFFIKGRQK